MKYRLEIWEKYSITTTKKSDDIEEVLKWYKRNWKWKYDIKLCAFRLFENGRELPYVELKKLGFIGGKDVL